MPYDIRQRDGRYCVIKRGDGENMGCHDSRAAAQRQMRALYVSEESATLDDILSLLDLVHGTS